MIPKTYLKYGYPPIIWKRHRSMQSIARAFFGVKLLDEIGAVGVGYMKNKAKLDLSLKDYMSAIKRQGHWGFAHRSRYPKREPHKIHYWYDGKGTPEQLFHLLAHEVGHLSDKQLRGTAAEEYRAESYGFAATAVLRRLQHDGVVRPGKPRK